MKAILVCVIPVLLTLSSQAEEVARIDLIASVPPTAKLSITKETSSFVVGGVTHGPQPRRPLEVSVEQVRKDPGDAYTASGSAEREIFKVRVKNVGEKEVVVPLDGDRDQMIRRCGSSGVVESSLQLGPKDGESSDSKESADSQLFGCKSMSKSVIVLRQGDWLTYKLALVSDERRKPEKLKASSMLSDATYSPVSGGFEKNTDTKLLIFSSTGND